MASSTQSVLAPGYVQAKRPKSLVIALVCCVAVVTAIYSLAHPVHDFVEYWSVSHLFIAHENPYSLGEVFQREKGLGFEQTIPIMLLSPPWALPLIAPLGFASSYKLACFALMTALIAAVGVSSKLLMDLYFGDLRIREISDTAFYRGLFAFTFYPVLLCLRYAQTAPFMLLGVAGFLYFESKQRPWLAGVFLSLTLIKPQLFYLVWLALIVRSVHKRQWKSLMGAGLTIALLSVTALWVQPKIFSQYYELTSSPYMQAYASGVMAGFRKLVGGVGTFWIQLLPLAAGLIWFARHWRKTGGSWFWQEQLPLLLTVSVLTSAYGWLFDQTLLAVPVIVLAGRAAQQAGTIPRNLVIFYTALNLGLMLAMALPTLNVVVAPASLIYVRWRASKVQAYSRPWVLEPNF